MSDEVISEERQQEASRQLEEVCNAGKRFTAELREGEKTMHTLAVKIAELDGEEASLRTQKEQLEEPGEGFWANDPIPASVTIKINGLRQQITDILEKRKHLAAIEAQTRLRLTKVRMSIQELQYAQRNLEAVARGENPASGPQGGAYRVSLGGNRKVL